LTNSALSLRTINAPACPAAASTPLSPITDGKQRLAVPGSVAPRINVD
jgi:hypothetical protein